MNRATKRPGRYSKSSDKPQKRRKLGATAPVTAPDSNISITSYLHHDSQSNKPTNTPTTPEQQPPPLLSDEFEARCILKERRRGGQKEYLIDWEGVDPQTGKAYLPSWEPEYNVGDWHIRNWNLEKQAKLKRPDTAYLPSQKPHTSSRSRSRPSSPDASLDYESAPAGVASLTVAATRRCKRRPHVIEDSSTDTDFGSVTPSHAIPRTPALESDVASTQAVSGPQSPSLEILESQNALSSSLPFALELPTHYINHEDFESYHSSQHSFLQLPPSSAEVLSQVTELQSSGKPSNSPGILSVAHQRLLGVGSSSSIFSTTNRPSQSPQQHPLSSRTNQNQDFDSEDIHPGTQRFLLSQPGLLLSSQPAHQKLPEAQEQRTPNRRNPKTQAKYSLSLSSAQQPLQPSIPRSSTPWQFRSQLLSPIAIDQNPQIAMDIPSTQQSSMPAATASIPSSQSSNHVPKESPGRALTPQPVIRPQSHDGRQSAPPPSLSVADYSSSSYDDLPTFTSAQAYLQDPNASVIPSIAAPIYDPVSSGSALPIQESIEEEVPSSSAEEASMGSKASSSQVSLENERLIPQIDGISLPLHPLLGPAEYTISLPAEGKIQSTYTDTIKAKRKSILKFISRPDSVGSTGPSTSRTRERNEMIELMERLHDTTTHFDLGLPGFSTQFNVRSEEHAAFAQYAGSKFVFLACLVDALSTVDCTVIIAAKPGPVQQLIEEFLVVKRIHVTRHDRPHSARSKTPDFHQMTLKIDLVDTSADTEIHLSSRPVLLVAFDASFDNHNPQIKQIRELYARGRNQLLPVVHLLTSNSSEHIDRCLRKSMPFSQRLKLLVKGTYQAQNNLGGSPTYVPDLSDRPEGRPMDMNDIQRAVRKSPNRKLNMVAHIVARAAITEDFEQYWTLGAMPEVQYDELDDSPPDYGELSTGEANTGTPTAHNDHDRSRTPVSGADTPSGKKRLLDPDDVKLQALLFKRQRMSPLTDAANIQEAARDGTIELELREQIKALQAELSSERQARIKAEADLELEKSRRADWEKAHNIIMQRYDLRRLKQHKIDRENKRLQGLVESTKEKNEKLIESNKNLREQTANFKFELSTTREELKASAVPELAALEAARSEAREASAKVASLEKQVQNKNQDFEFTRQQYQQASNRAAELGKENSEFESEIARLKGEASDEKRKLRELTISETTKQDLDRIDHLEQENKALERLTKKMREELEMVKKTRGVQTRGSSVQPPGSPAGIGTRSRQASPALNNHRVSGLRNERS